MNNKKRFNETEPKIEYTNIFKVKRTQELLEFLLEKCNTSRNNVKMLLKNHQIVVNGSVVTQFNLLLATEDEVKISKKPIRELANNKIKSRQIKKPLPRIDILYEDDDFIAIDKPQGLLSVESDKDTNSAFDLVLKYLNETSKSLRPFTIHRIDKETSGILVFAKSPVIQSKLRLNWNDYVKTREYIAVVKGKMPKKEDRLFYKLLENQNNLVYVSKSNEGQDSITNYKVIKETNSLSLVKVLIETGRKNQIRVVFNHIGNPIIGDIKYNPNDGLGPLKRLGLHASKLEFLHPITKELISIESKAPNTFNGLFNK